MRIREGSLYQGAEHDLLETLAKKKKLKAETFRSLGDKFQVCPYELQLAAAAEADTVICDYNYVFAPRSALGNLNAISIDQQGSPNLVIDEAHIFLRARWIITLLHYRVLLSTKCVKI